MVLSRAGIAAVFSVYVNIIHVYVYIYVYIYIYTYTRIHTYVYIYIYIERERGICTSLLLQSSYVTSKVVCNGMYA